VRRLRGVGCLACVLALLGLPAGCPTDGTGAGDGALDGDGTGNDNGVVLPEVDPDDPLLQLLSRAEQIVEADHPRAVLVEARGTPAGATATTADDIVTWRFLFMADSEVPGASTVVLDYADGKFGEPQLLMQGLVGTMYERLPRTMTLTTAIQFMRAAGYDAPFSQVVLRKPLTFPVPYEAYYAFTMGSRTVLVGMATGEVSIE
jgi:hypothetical protein